MKSLKLLFVFLSIFCFSQNREIAGIVMSAETKTPIEYANIGVVNSVTATITDDKGFFKLNVPENLAHSEIKIRSIGYETQTLNVSDFQENKMIYLQPVYQVQEIEEVVVQKKDLKEKELGTKTSSRKRVTGWYNGPAIGGERGILIDPKNKISYIKNVSFHVALNDYENVDIRLHIRTLKNNMPDEELLYENIIIPVTTKKGWIKKDLSSYHIKFNEPIMVSLEFLNSSSYCMGKCYFAVSESKFSGVEYVKEASEYVWKIVNGTSPAIYLTVLQEK
ncbi:MAG: carboxypeptidase-like regulatory domain-containing protein [Flavobacteriaceae bacterium]|jgi:hypothetical protein|nr:carboxypeptidase-like regulatory domain-containing protein [Flavobacteriaceae bacterium]